jgi:hypothetical protein
VATGIYIGLIQLLGGPSGGDAFESIYSTWAVAHGYISCIYPPHPPTTPTFVAPMYPLVSGAVAAIFRIGHSVPFPSKAALGPNCVHALPKAVHWSLASNAVIPTLRVSYVSWLFLMAGIVMVLRASGRGRCVWEPATLIIVACLPPVWMSLQFFFHPQDIMAMGFGLAAMACALRNRWVAAGILIVCGVLSNQYALLVALPLLVVAPREQRLRYIGGAIAAAVVIITPLLVLTWGSAAHFIFIGTGYGPGQGGTVLWELHLHGTVLVSISRFVPLLLSGVIAWFVVRRLGRDALRPAVLIAMVSLTLSMRLVFEENTFGYYYLALAVGLILLDVVRGHIRASLIAWLALTMLAYSEGTLGIIMWRRSWGQDARHWIPAVIMIVALLLIVERVLRHRVDWNLLIYGGLVFGGLIMWPVSSDPLHHQPPTWLWQVVLVAAGVTLAAGPLRDLLRRQPEQPAVEPLEPVPSVI